MPKEAVIGRALATTAIVASATPMFLE